MIPPSDCYYVFLCLLHCRSAPAGLKHQYCTTPDVISETSCCAHVIVTQPRWKHTRMQSDLYWKQTKNRQIVSTCCQVAVADPGSNKHRGNNQASSPEVSPLRFNPEETEKPRGLVFTTRTGVACQDHTLFITPANADAARTERRTEKKNIKKWDQQFRGALAPCHDRGWIIWQAEMEQSGREMSVIQSYETLNTKSKTLQQIQFLQEQQEGPQTGKKEHN